MSKGLFSWAMLVSGRVADINIDGLISRLHLPFSGNSPNLGYHFRTTYLAARLHRDLQPFTSPKTNGVSTQVMKVWIRWFALFKQVMASGSRCKSRWFSGEYWPFLIFWCFSQSNDSHHFYGWNMTKWRTKTNVYNQNGLYTCLDIEILDMYIYTTYMHNIYIYKWYFYIHIYYIYSI